MKNHKKNYFKTNLIGFILGGFLISGVAVYAAGTFPSNDVTYDNSSSGLSSTNVKGAIDELYKQCTRIPASDQIIEDAGLTKDPYECRYFFTGTDPNNYITFNGEQAGWRIISVECDGSIKILHNECIDGNAGIAWNTTGSNNWVNASLNTYLNNNYYSTLNSEAQSQIVAKNFSIGGVTYDNNDLSDQINDENSKTWNGKIGLPTVSEYIRVNSNTSLCGTFSTHVKYRNTCKQTSWMSNAPDWWTLSANAADSYNAYAVNFYAYFMNQSVANKVSFGVRPAIYLKSDLNLSGSGTSSDPYTIE